MNEYNKLDHNLQGKDFEVDTYKKALIRAGIESVFDEIEKLARHEESNNEE